MIPSLHSLLTLQQNDPKQLQEVLTDLISRFVDMLSGPLNDLHGFLAIAEILRQTEQQEVLAQKLPNITAQVDSFLSEPERVGDTLAQVVFSGTVLCLVSGDVRTRLEDVLDALHDDIDLEPTRFAVWSNEARRLSEALSIGTHPLSGPLQAIGRSAERTILHEKLGLIDLNEPVARSEAWSISKTTAYPGQWPAVLLSAPRPLESAAVFSARLAEAAIQIGLPLFLRTAQVPEASNLHAVLLQTTEALQCAPVRWLERRRARPGLIVCPTPEAKRVFFLHITPTAWRGEGLKTLAQDLELIQPTTDLRPILDALEQTGWVERVETVHTTGPLVSIFENLLPEPATAPPLTQAPLVPHPSPSGVWSRMWPAIIGGLMAAAALLLVLQPGTLEPDRISKANVGPDGILHITGPQTFQALSPDRQLWGVIPEAAHQVDLDWDEPLSAGYTAHAFWSFNGTCASLSGERGVISTLNSPVHTVVPDEESALVVVVSKENDQVAITLIQNMARRMRYGRLPLDQELPPDLWLIGAEVGLTSRPGPVAEHIDAEIFIRQELDSGRVEQTVAIGQVPAILLRPAPVQIWMIRGPKDNGEHMLQIQILDPETGTRRTLYADDGSIAQLLPGGEGKQIDYDEAEDGFILSTASSKSDGVGLSGTQLMLNWEEQ